MANTFFFYDLETSGVNPRSARIMQFAGQRTDMELNPIGEPLNILVKLSEDILPEPDAVMVTGITPQQTISDGISEAEFFKIFTSEVVKDGTIFVGFNSIRFDDEFIRFGLYRNFYDAYEWQWKNNCSKWDILDLVRITRALRPEGINWPFASDGKASNRLELLTSVNKLNHDNAHDALNDVFATIAVAKMIKEKQPKLFGYLLSLRGKKDVENLVMAGQPFAYVSGMYSADNEKLTIAYALGLNSNKSGAFVYDLRHSPEKYLKLPPNKLAELWRWKKDSTEERLPVKTLQFNKCPAISPVIVIRDEDAKRLNISQDVINSNLSLLKDNGDFYERLLQASKILEGERVQTELIGDPQNVDSQLYDGFFSDSDRSLFPEFRNSSPEEVSNYQEKFHDSRLKSLVGLYKARNFTKFLTPEEQIEWEKFKAQKIQKSLPKFMERLQTLSLQPGMTSSQQYLMEELRLYAESIMPSDI